MQQGKSTVPQLPSTSLQQVEPLGKVQQTESDGLFLPEQTAVGEPKEERVGDPARCTRDRDVNRSTCVQGPGPQSDQPKVASCRGRPRVESPPTAVNDPRVLRGRCRDGHGSTRPVESDR